MKVNWNVKVDNNFPYADKATTFDLASALHIVGEEIMTYAKQETVPVDTGALRNSGTVMPGPVTKNRQTVILGFGGDAAPYAAAVHEAPRSYGQGKNKYLSRAINQFVPNIPRRLADLMRNRVRIRTGL